jgi:hypothetical protein
MTQIKNILLASGLTSLACLGVAVAAVVDRPRRRP